MSWRPRWRGPRPRTGSTRRRSACRARAPHRARAWRAARRRGRPRPWAARRRRSGPRALARCAHDLLVDLRQLAADRGGAVGIGVGEHAQGGCDARRGDSKATSVSGRGEELLELAALAGQEAHEPPGIGGQRGGDERSQHRRGPGSTSNRQAGGHASRTRTKARIGHQRHPGVGDQRHRPPRRPSAAPAPPPACARCARGRDERRADAVAVEQRAGAARVLAGDDVGLAQRGQDPQRDVLEVADRRRAGRRACPRLHTDAASLPIASKASSAAPSMPASVPKRAGTIFTTVARGAQAALGEDLAGGSSTRSPAASAPPPSTTYCGLKMFT